MDDVVSNTMKVARGKNMDKYQEIVKDTRM
jgi:hypothetical protein